jgi:methylene-tetrahydromethanopterin dehydrogenase
MAKHILHMLSPLKHMSPFDVNMAVDAGFDAVIPYVGVTLDEVVPLVQDAMFSRPPKDAVRTGIFIAGKDVILALDMIEAARNALLKPFEVSIFADPAGSFTTAAAMVACVEKTLREKKSRSLAGANVIIFGATGVVGFCSAVISALEGAHVTLAGHDGPRRVEKGASEIHKRFNVSVDFIDASTNDAKIAGLQKADVLLCAGKAGVQIFSSEDLQKAPRLLVAADVNAVPPLGLEGLELHANGVELPGGSLGIGALAIGNVKYQTEFQLFEKMAASDRPLCLDFRDAFELARKLA